MEISLCWYHNKNGSMWIYDLTNHLMVELETIIALATMIYIVVVIFLKNYIRWINAHSMISPMIIKYVLLRVF